jgi:hypothetical protein
MDELRLPSAIENSQRILVAGAGGGFDVYAGLPVYERLRLWPVNRPKPSSNGRYRSLAFFSCEPAESQ